MTFKKLVLELCRVEGKRKQVDVSQMTETVSRLRQLIQANPLGVLRVLLGGK